MYGDITIEKTPIKALKNAFQFQGGYGPQDIERIFSDTSPLHRGLSDDISSLTVATK